jgi:isoleucyl-tRNA synthetase
MTKFQKVPSKPSFVEQEQNTLAKWKAEKTFEEQTNQHKDKQEFVMYDGPPFPTGSPHYGTLFVSILKDIIGRYKSMQGYYVPRKWGWDCHGLPIETQAEKKLNIKQKQEIETKIGVKKFNDTCREIVSGYNDAWRTYIDAIGRWVDFDHPYRTLDFSFMESVIWAFGECHKKGYVYEGFRVTPYCYRCETALSISDTRESDSTRPKQDPALTVTFKVNRQKDTYFLAWTTTPWTLPSNLALGVNPKESYAFVEHENKTYILAEKRISAYKQFSQDDIKILKTINGQELIESYDSYEPLFSYFKDNPKSFRLIAADFVSQSEGTGIVHLAPAFGEDDYWTCKKENIPLVNPVNNSGCFTDQCDANITGKNVHEAQATIINMLKEEGKIFSHETIDHNYPHCWRCRTPLIYRAMDAWYIHIEKIRESLEKENKNISWHPELLQDGRFGKWLSGARDWNISRNRYWGTPIPIWKCDTCNNQEVLDSSEKMSEKHGEKVTDLHKEHLDAITYSCTSCEKGTMKRISEVLDCWFESGSMPFAQVHYPFENKEWFENHFPADFIVEYTGQIRTWFYYLHVLGIILFDKPAFKNCLVHGTLLAEDGKKMSKSLKNYTDPLDLMNVYGGDTIRAYLLQSTAVQIEDFRFSDIGVKNVFKSLHIPLWNSLIFLTTYGEIDEIDTDMLDIHKYSEHFTDLDKYILSELEGLKTKVTHGLETYKINIATKSFFDFLDILNNWYIRRNRERIWKKEKHNDDKLTCYSVLHFVLSQYSILLAPFCPFLSEKTWEHLGYKKSVHLEAWPTAQDNFLFPKVQDNMNAVRTIISLGLHIRAEHNIKVRQALQEVKIALPKDLHATLISYNDIIKEELNVKEITFLENPLEIARQIGKPDARKLGPKYGKQVQQIIQAAKKGNITLQDDGTILVESFVLNPDEIELIYEGKEGMMAQGEKGMVVALDIKITEELREEGNMRDIIRYIQDLRKLSGLDITDRIQLYIDGQNALISKYKDHITNVTLVENWLSDVPQKYDGSVEVQIGEETLNIYISKQTMQ